jgi:hypothetical protein
MRFKRQILTLAILLAGLFPSQAQVPLRIAVLNSTPDSLTLGSSFSFTVSVQNVDSFATFNGSIRLSYSINGFPQQMDSASGLAYDTSFTIANLPPFDTVRKSITVNVTNPRFQTGPSVVVIWPIASGAIAKDSLVLDILVLPPLGITPIEQDVVRAYVTNDQIFIRADTGTILKQVRVFDIMGSRIMDVMNPSSNLPLPETSRGIYVAEIIYNDNQRKTIRFFR